MFRVVIADDEMTIRNGLKNLIESYDIDLQVVAMAEDGQEAIELIEQYHPEVILMDINMPLINGLDVIEKVQKIDKDSRIIIISGYDKFHYAQRALDLGVFSYLLKPIDYRNFKEILSKAIDDYSNRIWNRNLLEDKISNNIGAEDVGNQAIDFIKKNFDKSHLSLNMVAQNHHISESYLTRIVKEKVGLSFTDYLNKLRINMAINLLMNKHKKYTINEISDIVGYNSQHYFSRAFKNYIGISPSQYRKDNF